MDDALFTRSSERDVISVESPNPLYRPLKLGRMVARRRERELMMKARRNRELIFIFGNEVVMAILTVLVATNSIKAGVAPLCYTGMFFSLFSLEQAIMYEPGHRIEGAYIMIIIGWIFMLSGLILKI